MLRTVGSRIARAFSEAEIGRGNGVKESPHVASALRSERFLELPLRLHPSFHPRRCVSVDRGSLAAVPRCVGEQ